MGHFSKNGGGVGVEEYFEILYVGGGVKLGKRHETFQNDNTCYKSPKCDSLSFYFSFSLFCCFVFCILCEHRLIINIDKLLYHTWHGFLHKIYMIIWY